MSPKVIVLFLNLTSLVANAACSGETEDVAKLNERIGALEGKLDHMIGSQSALVSKVESLESREQALLARIADLEVKGQRHQLMRGRRQVTHVAFTAYLDHAVQSLSADEIIVYNQVLLNHGTGYDNATGIFLVPTSGVYLFSWTTTAKDDPNHYERAKDVFTKLTVNGVHMLGAVAESVMTNDDEQAGNTAILEVHEGDKVWTAHIGRGASQVYGEPGERTSSFAGVLLYPVQEDSNAQLIG